MSEDKEKIIEEHLAPYKKKQKMIEKSIEESKTMKELRTEALSDAIQPIEPEKQMPEYRKAKEKLKEKPEKAKVTIKDQPSLKEIKLREGTIQLEITPEMAETLMMGIFDTIAFLSPKTFNSPKKEHGAMIRQPAYQVIQRWMPHLDILKYLPEIILATSFVTVLKDMKIKEVNK